MSVQDPGEGLPLELVVMGDMTIRHAGDLKPELLPALAHPGPVTLDLAQVEAIDATGVQLLLATRQAVEAQARSFLLGARSAAVDDALALLGLDAQFAAASDLPSVH
ncbi:STAS domain-containing protein [Xanthomonas sp. Kuri4-1]